MHDSRRLVGKCAHRQTNTPARAAPHRQAAVPTSTAADATADAFAFSRIFRISRSRSGRRSFLASASCCSANMFEGAAASASSPAQLLLSGPLPAYVMPDWR